MSLQIEVKQPEPTSTFQTQEGKFFRSFLIGTKPNEAGWYIRRETGHEKVKDFLTERKNNFAIIPELIQKPISEGGGGHYKGTREQILKAYEDNSHGKIVKLLGPFYYADSPQDYWYDQITQLNNSRSAAVLHTEGQKTWNGYDVSPHIGVNKGSDKNGWEDWEALGLNLVIRGAFGPQAIITKFCDGSESKCFKDLVASSSSTTDEKIADILTSYISKIASTPHSMPDQPPAKPDTGIPDAGIASKDKTNPTTDSQKHLTDAPKVNETVSISKEELDRLRKEQMQLPRWRTKESRKFLQIFLQYLTTRKSEKKRLRIMQSWT